MCVHLHINGVRLQRRRRRIPFPYVGCAFHSLLLLLLLLLMLLWWLLLCKVVNIFVKWNSFRNCCLFFCYLCHCQRCCCRCCFLCRGLGGLDSTLVVILALLRLPLLMNTTCNCNNHNCISIYLCRCPLCHCRCLDSVRGFCFRN